MTEVVCDFVHTASTLVSLWKVTIGPSDRFTSARSHCGTALFVFNNFSLTYVTAPLQINNLFYGNRSLSALRTYHANLEPPLPTIEGKRDLLTSVQYLDALADQFFSTFGPFCQ